MKMMKHISSSFQKKAKRMQTSELDFGAQASKRSTYRRGSVGVGPNWKPGQGQLRQYLRKKISSSVFAQASGVAAIPSVISMVCTWIRMHHPDVLPDELFPADIQGLASTLSWVLGFLLVFRTGLAYNRFWSGTLGLYRLMTEWHDICSMFCASAQASTKTEEEKIFIFQGTLVRLFSLLSACALRQVSDVDDEQLRVIDLSSLEQSSLQYMLTRENFAERTEIVISWVQQLVLKALADGTLTTPPPIVSMGFSAVHAGTCTLSEICAISEVPLSVPYAHMIMVLLVMHSIASPLMIAPVASHWVWSGIFCFATVFVMWVIQMIAAQIERPFGDDSEDLNLAAAQDKMNESLSALLNPQTYLVPMMKIESSKWQASTDMSWQDSTQSDVYHVKTTQSQYGARPGRMSLCQTKRMSQANVQFRLQSSPTSSDAVDTDGAQLSASSATGARLQTQQRSSEQSSSFTLVQSSSFTQETRICNLASVASDAAASAALRYRDSTKSDLSAAEKSTQQAPVYNLASMQVGEQGNSTAPSVGLSQDGSTLRGPHSFPSRISEGSEGQEEHDCPSRQSVDAHCSQAGGTLQTAQPAQNPLQVTAPAVDNRMSLSDLDGIGVSELNGEREAQHPVHQKSQPQISSTASTKQGPDISRSNQNPRATGASGGQWL